MVNILNKFYEIYYIGISDFLDRIRNKSSMLVILFMMYITYLFFPQTGATVYYTLNFYRNGSFYRGIYNSAWLGWVSTIAFISVITLVGFYLVNNSIKRERQLLVGEITSSLPINSWVFIFGKTFGSFLFLLVQSLIVILITIIMQLVRGESYSIEIIKLVTPFIILVVPVCFIVAVIAIVFENIPFLSGTFGNIVYFFTWSGLLAVSVVNEKNTLITDVFGIKYASEVIIQQVKNNFKELGDFDSFNLGNSGGIYDNIKTFVMNEVNISYNILLGRIFWISIALLLLYLVSIIFRRNSLLITKPTRKIKIPLQNTVEEYKQRTVHLTPILETKNYLNPLSIIKSEFNIIFNTPSTVWYVMLAALSIGIFFTTGEIQNKVMLPLTWILPIFIWSRFGSLQKNYNMENYLFAYENYRNSQLICSFIAGFIFTLLINISILTKFILQNNIVGVLCISMAAVFVTALGIFIGNSTGSSTLFEIIYIILWYIGILNGAPYMNFLGITQKGMDIRTSITFFMIGIMLLMSSGVIKRTRMLLKS